MSKKKILFGLAAVVVLLVGGALVAATMQPGSFRVERAHVRLEAAVSG